MFNSNNWVDEEARRASGAWVSPENSIIFAKVGAAIFLERKRILSMSSCIDNNVMSFVLDASASKEVNFFYHLLDNIELGKLVSTTALPSLSGRQIASLKFGRPPIEEQRAIASALDDMDDLLASLRRMQRKKSDVREGAKQQLLSGRVRLAGFGEPVGAGSGDVVPDGWEVTALGELFSFKNGLNKAKSYFGHGTPIINYMDVYNRSGLWPSHIDGLVDVTRPEIAAYGAQKGDVFFTRTSETTGDIGVAAVMMEDVTDAVFSGFLLRARSKTDALRNEFKRYCFSSASVRRQIVSRSTYTTRALTNGRSLSAVTILVPPHPEQEAIARVLSDMDEELDVLEEKIVKYERIKAGMKKELLAGRMRLV